jgi:hypothetical protein
MKLLGIINVGLSRSTTDQIFCIRQILEKKWDYNETVHQLFIDFKKAYDSVRREVMYNILTELGVPLKLVRLIKMCKHLYDSFPTQNGLKQGDILSPLLFNLLLNMPLGRSSKTRWD